MVYELHMYQMKCFPFGSPITALNSERLQFGGGEKSGGRNSMLNGEKKTHVKSSNNSTQN